MAAARVRSTVLCSEPGERQASALLKRYFPLPGNQLALVRRPNLLAVAALLVKLVRRQALRNHACFCFAASATAHKRELCRTPLQAAAKGA